MSGCFGGSSYDRWMQSNLDRYLDSEDESEFAMEYICSKEGADHVEDDIFERQDGTRFEVVRYPELRPDCDEDGPCGSYWTEYRIREIETEQEDDDC